MICVKNLCICDAFDLQKIRQDLFDPISRPKGGGGRTVIRIGVCGGDERCIDIDTRPSSFRSTLYVPSTQFISLARHGIPVGWVASGKDVQRRYMTTTLAR
jgi:hypothetical protein